MSAVLMYGSGVPVVKIGRMAGQFAKPRSSDLEVIDGVSLPSYRGDNINSDEFTKEARTPNPARLVQAYNQSAATLNLLRGFAMGGYAPPARSRLSLSLSLVVAPATPLRAPSRFPSRRRRLDCPSVAPTPSRRSLNSTG
jgi:hypothetical protein